MSSAHSPTFPSLHLCHSSFSNRSFALPTSQLILQPFHCFTYVTAHSPNLLSLYLHHRLFTYVTYLASCPCHIQEDFYVLLLTTRLKSIVKCTTNYTTVVQKSSGLVIIVFHMYVKELRRLTEVCRIMVSRALKSQLSQKRKNIVASTLVHTLPFA